MSPLANLLVVPTLPVVTGVGMASVFAGLVWHGLSVAWTRLPRSHDVDGLGLSPDGAGSGTDHGRPEAGRWLRWQGALLCFRPHWCWRGGQ